MPHGIISSETQIHGTWFIRVNGAIWATYHDNHVMCGETKLPASVSNPKVLGYRSPSAWYCRRSRWQLSGGAIRYSWNQWPHLEENVGDLTSFGLGDSRRLVYIDPSLADTLLKNTLSKMVEDDVAFNAFMLQGKQALKMVGNLATGIAHGTDALMTAEFKRPGNFRRFLANAANSAIRDFSGKYLEYLYGWKPLADDVENAFQSMIDGYTGPEQKRFRLAVRGHKQVKGEEDLIQSVACWFTSSNWSSIQRIRRVNKARLVLNYSFPSQAGEMLPTMTPFGTAWELTPWSFVLDWFVPVGNWIGAMEATQYAVYLQNAILTQSVEVASIPGKISRWNSQIERSGYTIVDSTPPSLSGHDFYMTREVLSSVNVLDRIKFPSFSSKFGLPQASQALALLSQVLNKWK